jgi:hypothetical protein
VSLDYDSRYDDCRAIETIGFESVDGGFTRRTPAEVHRLVADADHSAYVVYRDERSTLRPVTDGDHAYVRTEPEDTPEDPLLKQPSC